MPILYF